MEKREIGVMAQNLETNFRFAVSERKKPEDTLFVHYPTLNIHLIEALKVLIDKNKDLDGALKHARNRFDSLSREFEQKTNL